MLVDVVVDPTSKDVSHVVVQPRHHPDRARLVPVADLVADEEAGRLVCSSGVDSYPLIESTQFVKMSVPVELAGDWEVGIEHVSAFPYYTADFGEFNRSLYPDSFEEVGITFHRIPKGKVEIRRASDVLSADGDRLGRVDGFVVSADHVTHLVLDQGHLWGRHEVTIPVSGVRSISNDEVHLSLTAAEVEALPRPKVVVRP